MLVAVKARLLVEKAERMDDLVDRFADGHEAAFRLLVRRLKGDDLSSSQLTDEGPTPGDQHRSEQKILDTKQYQHLCTDIACD